LAKVKTIVKKKRRRRGRLRGKYFSTKMNIEMTYRSSWELFYFQYLDSNIEVLKYYSESLRIPYVANVRSGRVRNYIPDLLIEYETKKILVEIKPSSKLMHRTNVKKFAAARNFCIINNIEFMIITEIELRKLGLK